MDCKSFKQQLISINSISELSGDMQNHLDSCTECSIQFKILLEIDREMNLEKQQLVSYDLFAQIQHQINHDLSNKIGFLGNLRWQLIAASLIAGIAIGMVLSAVLPNSSDIPIDFTGFNEMIDEPLEFEMLNNMDYE